MQRLFQKIMLNNTCIVFDLDDTLYQEADYQRSGYESIADLVEQLLGIDVRAEMQRAHDASEDVFDNVCRLTGQPTSFKQSLLWHYRLHKPNIVLSPSVFSTLEYIKTHALYCCILTDGRSVSQRLKANALGLGDLDIFVSEEWGEPKPDSTRFDYIMNNVIASRYVYVGDNPKKDFITPNQLGWVTIGILGCGQNIHSQTGVLPLEYSPMYWVEDFNKLRRILC